MLKHKTMNAQEIAIIFSTFCKIGSLQNAFRLLNKLLSEVMPMDRITAFCVYSIIETVIVLVDTEEELEKSALHNFSFTKKVFTEEEFNNPCIFNSLSELRKLEGDKHISKSPLYSSESMVRIPFYKHEAVILVLDFFSKENNAYTEEHFEFLQEVVRLSQDTFEEAFNLVINDIPVNKASIDYSPFDYLAMCPSIDEICQVIKKVASTDVTVLITGESGTGKELAAQAIHEKSSRKNKEFVAINCGALPESLIDSELFGHEKGSFTGAIQTFIGAFERAQNGTLFLDEIGEMPMGAQARLLRAIENKTIRKIGGSKNIYLNVRIIAASNVNLQKAVEEGRFRKDLLYRLNLFNVHLPPLRERKLDIRVLTKFYLNKFTKDYKISTTIQEEMIDWDKILAYDWKGNVRELKSFIERYIILHENKKMLEPDMPEFFINDEKSKFPNDISKMYSLEELEKMYISHVLEVTDYKFSGKNSACEVLGIHYTTLKAKMHKYELTASDKG